MIFDARGLRGVIAAGALGLVFGLVGPPTDLYFAPWIALPGLAWILHEGPPGSRRRALDGAGRGLAFGAFANFVFLAFVPPVIVRFTSLPLAAGYACQALLAVVQGLGWSVAGWFTVHLARRGVPRWVAFAMGVFACCFMPAVFPWTPAGLVSPAPRMIQLAELVGDHGVTALMAISAGLLAEALEPSSPAATRSRANRRALLALAGLALPLLTYVEGGLRIARVEEARRDAPTLTLGLVQPAIGALARWDFARAPSIVASLTSLTESAEKQGAEATLWSESAYPYPFQHAARKVPGSHVVVAPTLHGPILAGLLTLGPGHDQHNSAAVFQADGSFGEPQDKVHLLPFGEEIPYVGGIPWVRRTFARGLGLVAGEGMVLQTFGAARASVLICVEDILPVAGREAMAVHPNLLVNLTNDAWFEGSQESELHLRLAIPRAVESRRDMVRAVNLGPTTWVDAAGVVRARYDSLEPGVLMARPALLEWAPTPYDRFGDWPLALVLALVAAGRIFRARRLSA